MLGALAGDLIGSVHEHHPIKTTGFPLFRPGNRFTDDGVLTVAVADAILTGRPYREAVLDWGRRYPRSGYGGAFRAWPRERDPRPCGSWGNGSAMRVGPVGWAFATEDDVLNRAAASAAIAAKPESRVRLGDALAALGRQIGLTHEDVELLRPARDKTPAEPLRFE